MVLIKILLNELSESKDEPVRTKAEKMLDTLKNPETRAALNQNPR